MFETLFTFAATQDPAGIVLAVAICLLGTFAAFFLLRGAQNKTPPSLVRIFVAAAVAGIAAWLMHIVPFRGFLSGVRPSFDLVPIHLSLIPAILNTGIGFTFCRRNKGSTWIAGIFIGAGFAMMQYMWMMSISAVAVIVWRWDLVVSSVLICLGLSVAAVALYRRQKPVRIIYPALLLALGIFILHFFAVVAVETHSDPRITTAQQALDPQGLAILMGATSLLLMVTALGAALLDRVGMNRKLAEAVEIKRLADEVMVGAAERERLLGELKRQYEITTAALDNMGHSLCMYDKDDRLVIWNRRYAEMSEFPDGFLVPGLPFETLARYQIESGQVPGTLDQYRQNLANWAADPADRDVMRPNGRILHVHREQLENGGWILTHDDVTERRRAVDRIAYLATHDELTGLPNRRSFTDAMNEAAEAAKTGRSFALLTIDLDRFKEVNDTLGHPVGDEILKEAASRLRSLVRDGDVVTRLGGDEFAILQQGVATTDDAAHLAARIVELLAQPYEFDGHTVTVGGTVGIALASREDCDAEELVKRSDLALYRAKQHSRGSYSFFEQDMAAHLFARRDLEMGLRLAIQKGEFELHYQPLLNMASQTIVGFEALVRWHHPTRGLLHPAEFIPAAEASGLIIPIGEWVLRQACKDAAQWPSPVHVSVNLSAAQLKRGDLLAMTKSALASAGLPPERLEIELTESVLLHDEEWVRALLLQLRELGIRIAMDDFGTGYSSLSYLRTFPFSKIKIDRSFVSDMHESKDSLAIVQATIGLSMKLGMSTTAEGVETAEQLDMLAAEGCTEIQGFYISRPVPVGQVEELLRRYGTGDIAPLKAAS